MTFDKRRIIFKLQNRIAFWLNEAGRLTPEVKSFDRLQILNVGTTKNKEDKMNLQAYLMPALVAMIVLAIVFRVPAIKKIIIG